MQSNVQELFTSTELEWSLHFIVSLLRRWLEETIKAEALKDCLCCVLPNAWITKHMFLNGLRALTEQIMSQSQDHLKRSNHGVL